MSEYNEAIEVFNDNTFKNMFDYLEYYNNCDVIPMVEAINKMFQFYRARNLDMFKDAISLPGLAYKMLMNCPKANFSLFEEEHKHLYYLLKNNIRGGPSIIFNRYQEVDKTYIRNGKLCKNIIGFDANALYLWAIMQKMPTGQYKQPGAPAQNRCRHFFILAIPKKIEKGIQMRDTFSQIQGRYPEDVTDVTEAAPN